MIFGDRLLVLVQQDNASVLGATRVEISFLNMDRFFNPFCISEFKLSRGFENVKGRVVEDRD